MKIKELFIIFGMLNTLLLFSCISKPNKEDSALTDKDIAQFDSLFYAWEKEISSNPKTKYNSSTQTYTTLPQFKELVSMGKKIIPCIIERFEKDSNSFFAIPLYNELQEIKELKSCTKTSEQEKMREIISKFREQEKAKIVISHINHKNSIVGCYKRVFSTWLMGGGGSSPIQTKATIKMIKVFNTQPQRNFSLFRSAS